MQRPIGVFDSGVGGISVLREIRALLPAEDLLYVADSAHVPYGPKTREFVESRSLDILQFFANRNVKAVVVACNTATAAAIGLLRSSFAFPIVGVEPAVKPAVESSRSGVVGVLATPGTLSSQKFAGLVERFRDRARVIVQPCEGWVQLVECGQLDGAVVRSQVLVQVQPLLDAGADTLVLGCTHYPFLLSAIQAVVGDGVRIVDSGAAIARRLADMLGERGLSRGVNGLGGTHFFTSGAPEALASMLPLLWGAAEVVERLPGPVARQVIG